MAARCGIICKLHSFPSHSGEWRNGIRNGLKIRRGDPCEFDSHLAHHVQKLEVERLRRFPCCMSGVSEAFD